MVSVNVEGLFAVYFLSTKRAQSLLHLIRTRFAALTHRSVRNTFSCVLEAVDHRVWYGLGLKWALFAKSNSLSSFTMLYLMDKLKRSHCSMLNGITSPTLLHHSELGTTPSAVPYLHPSVPLVPSNAASWARLAAACADTCHWYLRGSVLFLSVRLCCVLGFCYLIH